jgi:hypothetical protein
MRANADRIITLNCGVGRDSTTMMCLLFRDRLFVEGVGMLGIGDIDMVVFSDTGCEWPHTYEFLPTLRKICESYDVPFVVLEKSCDRYHYRLAVIDDYQSRETVVSLGKGDCTDNHKIQPIRRLLNELSMKRFGLNNRQWAHQVKKGLRPKHLTLIGYAADEQRRLNNGAGRAPKYVTEGFPLIDMDITKAGEAKILREWDLDFVRKSGCYVCPYQPAGWWWALSTAEPELWDRAMEYERIALARNPRMPATGYKKKGKPGTIVEMVRSWREKNPHATVDDVLAKTYSQCPERARAEMKGL